MSSSPLEGSRLGGDRWEMGGWVGGIAKHPLVRLVVGLFLERWHGERVWCGGRRLLA